MIMFAQSKIREKDVNPRWAWEPYRPDDRRPWTLALAGHLFRRAAFGATWKELQRAMTEGPQRTVGRLLHPEGDVDSFNREQDRYEDTATGSGSADTLRAWWLRRMIQTPHPLLEKMTLFWHGHFAISNFRVKSSLLMSRHVRLLRSHCLGSFRKLLEEIVLDPALLVGLDAGANRKARPSEGYARGLLELFCLGPGQASPGDFREAARAFTGWFVLQDRLRYFSREHDAGTKRILGQEGNFAPGDVVKIVLQQRAAPEFIVRQLYRWLISETVMSETATSETVTSENGEPGDALIRPLAESFGKSYDIADLVETMLRSNLFFSPAAYRRRIKSPVEFALGIVRGLEEVVPTDRMGMDLAALGQNLFNPPTVKGWPGGRCWINRFTLQGRSNLALDLLIDPKAYGGKLDPWKIAGIHGLQDSAGPFLIDLFLQGDVEAGARKGLLESAGGGPAGDRSRALRRLAHGVVTLPEFQLA